MNRTFKVVFNKARGALMVANEVTSSVQKKGTKAVVAASVLSVMAGVAMADDFTWGNQVRVDGVVNVTSSVSAPAFGEEKYDATSSKVEVVDGGELNISESGVNYGGAVISGGKLTVSGQTSGFHTGTGNLPKAEANFGAYDQFDMTGGEVELNTARIWIGALGSDYHDMNLSGGKITLDNGGITGMSGTQDGQTVGTTIKLSGSDIVVKAGDKNVINSVAVEMTDGSLTVNSGATLQLTTYTKDGVEWANPYTDKVGGDILFKGGQVDVNGKMVTNHMVLSDSAKMTVKGSVNGDFTNVGYGKDGSSLTVNGGELVIDGTQASAGVNVGAVSINGGKVTLTGKADGYDTAGAIPKAQTNLGGYDGFDMTGGEVNLTNARVWIGATDEDNPESYHDMNLSGGTITMNNGGITGMSGSVSVDGKDIGIGTQLNLSGTDIIVESGDKNVINSLAVNMTAGTLTVEKDAKLQLTTYAKEGVKWEGLYDEGKTYGQVVVSGGKIVNKGNLVAGDIVLSGTGVLETTAFLTDTGLNAPDKANTGTFSVDSLTLEEGGTLKLTTLNSKVEGTAQTAADNDRWLVQYDVNLNGGRVVTADGSDLKNIRVSASKNNLGGGLTIDGDYAFDHFSIGKTGDVTMNSGVLTLGDFEASGDFVQKGGMVVVNGSFVLNDNSDENDGAYTVDKGATLSLGESVVGEKLSGTKGGATLTLAGGEIEGYANQLFGTTEDEVDYAKTSGLIAAGATGIVTVKGDLTLSQDALKNAVKAYDGSNLVFESVKVEADAENPLVFDDAYGTALVEQAVAVGETGLTVDDGKTAGVGALVVDAATTELSVTGAGTLVLGGMNGQNVIQGADLGTLTAGKLQLGMTAESSGNVNVTDLKVANLDVVGNFTAQTVTLDNAGVATIQDNAKLSLTTLAGNGAMAVSGVLEVTEEVGATVNVAEGGLIALKDGTDVTGVINIGMPAAVATMSLTPESVAGIKFGGTSVAAKEIIANSFIEDADLEGVTGVYYAGASVSVGETGQINVGDATGASGALTVANGGALVVDANALGDKPLVEGNLVIDGGKAFALNLNKTGNFALATGGDAGDVEFVDDNLFIDAVTETVEGDGTVYLKATFDKASVGNDEVLASAMEQAMNVNGKNGAVFQAIGNEAAFVESNALNAAGVQAVKEYVAAPVTAGTYNVAYDSAALISNTLIKRNLEVKNGLGVWADVFYGSNETDTLYGSSGYSSDIYGGMLGVDMAFGEGARVGAALSIGSGDADSEGSVSKYSSDADFWGLSLYAGKDIGGLTFTADMSYLWLDNDINGTVAGASASESIDSTVFTIGGRADWIAYEGDVMQVVPHVGIRWANIDVDDYRGMSMGSMDVFEMPVGVTVKGNFETASGWTVTPAFDFTVAPQIGDTEVETIVGDVDVIDNVYNATIGVSAGNDTMRFGLDYKYGFGNEGRSNNTFNLKASYLF